VGVVLGPEVTLLGFLQRDLVATVECDLDPIIILGFRVSLFSNGFFFGFSIVFNCV